MNIFSTTQKIGEIVAILPKASEIFQKHRIDFCCGGHRLLAEAIEEQQLDSAVILSQLEAAYIETAKITGQTDFTAMSRSDLIEYIISTHHAYVKRTLPELSEFTTKILRVHGLHHEELLQVHKLFHQLKTELDQHLIKEEELLFPLIKEYDKKDDSVILARINKVMKETEDEHEGAGDILKELRKITNDYVIPEDACNSYRYTYDLLEKFESDLFRHIHLENNILFNSL